MKNKHAVRTVFLHSAILDDFIFYQSRVHNGNAPLFHCTTFGLDKNWDKTYRSQFVKQQSKLDMLADKRPTAYGLIDELKEQHAPEHSVAELLGQTNPNMTFGLCGKKHKLEKLVEIVSTFTLELEG